MAIKLKDGQTVRCAGCGDDITATDGGLVHRHPDRAGLFLCEICFDKFCERNAPDYD